MCAKGCCRLTDKLAKEEDDINRLCLDLHKTSVRPQPCQQTPEVNPHTVFIDPPPVSPQKCNHTFLSHRTVSPPSQLSRRRTTAANSRLETASAWSCEEPWAAAVTAVNVNISHFLHSASAMDIFLHGSRWMFWYLMGFGVVCALAGLEDSTMGSVADTVARVLRGCLENMPEGECPRPCYSGMLKLKYEDLELQCT